MYMKKRQILIIGLSLLFLAVLLGGVLAYALRPLHYRQDVYAATLDGDILELKLDVSLNRHLWKPDEMHGRIIVDEVEYVSFIDLHPELPIKGETGDRYFFDVPTDNILESRDQIIIMPIENRLDAFWFCFVRSGESYTYFCPAGSQAEAQAVADLLAAIDNCETFSASDGTGQYRQKRAPMRWQVALILSILPTPCALKGSFAITYLAAK